MSHRRLGPVRHSFVRRIAMCYVDLGDIEHVMSAHPLWSCEAHRPVRFCRPDYLGDPRVPLDEAVRTLVEETTGRVVTGPVGALTHLRTWGWCFNPISLYYCFDRTATEVEAVVASVTSTPWSERHDYVLEPDESGRLDATVEKRMHVSPFMAMSQSYRFRTSAPGETLSATVENVEAGSVIFRADLRLSRRELDRSAMTRLLVRYPFMTWRVSAGIYAEALKLRLEGAPVHPHPAVRPPPAGAGSDASPTKREGLRRRG